MPQRNNQGAFSLIELLCVIAIILILMGLMLGPIMKAYKRAKKLLDDSGTAPSSSVGFIQAKSGTQPAFRAL